MTKKELICNISLDNSTITFEHEKAVDIMHTLPPTAGTEAQIKQTKGKKLFFKSLRC